MVKLPEPFLTKMQTLLGAEYEDWLHSVTNEASLHGLRCNGLKITPDKLRDLLRIPLSPVRWCSSGFMYPAGERPAKSPLYHAGLFYIQEPSAMSSAAVLNPQPGERVLDICAAPGGKTVQLAALMGHKPNSLLVANDISASRCKALVKNLELAGVTNAVVLNEPPYKLAARFPGYFDKILVDAPCSGEGMFRRDPDAARGWAENKPEACVVLQREILHHAADMLKPGGQIAYSTCTFEPLENEGMISEFIQNHPMFSLLSIDHNKLGMSEGVPEWGGGYAGLRKAARIWPHKADGEGHFITLLEKRADGFPEATNEMTISRCDGSIKDLPLFQAFCSAHLLTAIDGSFVLHNRSLYRQPAGLPDLKGLRIARSGWYLGEFKTNRFEPSQAFAMGIGKTDVRYTVDFPLDSQYVLRYLKGESFVPEPEYIQDRADLSQKQNDNSVPTKVWALVCVEGYPLGWGKIMDGRLKNQYPQGWTLA